MTDVESTESSTQTPGKVYSTETLRYSRNQLIKVAIYLLGGDFCDRIFAGVYVPFMPLFMKPLGASNTLIVVLTAGLSGTVNLLFLPYVGMWSDRCRTRWGRRIPFFFWSTIGSAGALILIGYSSDIAALLHGHSRHLGALPVAGITLALLGVFSGTYHLFTMVMNNSYRFLLRDVVPLEVMPRFLALFQLVGRLGNLLFQWYLFQYMLRYPEVLLPSLGLILLLSSLLICWGVKEGEYPPPAPRSHRGVFRSYWHYFRQAFSVPLYRNFIIAHTLIIFGTVPTLQFLTLFARYNLSLSLRTMGHIAAAATLAFIILYYPIGWLCERFNPFRVVLVALVAGVVMQVFGYVGVHGPAMWLLYSVLVVPTLAGWLLGAQTIIMMLFPADRFGQFASTVTVVGFGSLMFLSVGVGRFMDAVGSNYRMIFVFMLVCYLASLGPMILVYRGWKQHGGPGNYVPPEPA